MLVEAANSSAFLGPEFRRSGIASFAITKTARETQKPEMS
jgi:hypothetical protein